MGDKAFQSKNEHKFAFLRRIIFQRAIAQCVGVVQLTVNETLSWYQESGGYESLEEVWLTKHCNSLYQKPALCYY